MSHIARLTQPKLDSPEDARRALVELIDRINQLVEEINRLADLIEPVD